MKNKKNLVLGLAALVLFAFVLLSPQIFSFFFWDPAGNAEEGVGEKRTLAEFPTEYSDNYFAKVESWYSDHSPMRNTIIRMKNAVTVKLEDSFDGGLRPFLTDLLLGKPDKPDPEGTTPETKKPVDPNRDPNEPDCDHEYGEATVLREPTCGLEGISERVCAKCGYHKQTALETLPHTFRTVWENKASGDMNTFTLVKCDVCGGWEVQNFSQKLSSRTLAPVYKSKTGDILATAILGKNDWYFYAGDDTEKYYTGENLLSDEEMLSWKNSLEALQKVCDERGILLAVATAPNKEEMYPEWMPTTYDIQTETKRAQLFYEYMQENSTVHYEYLKDALSEVKKVFPVYYKQDTHWNNVGGFVGTMQLYKAVGLPTVNVFDLYEAGLVSKGTHNGGDLAGFVGKSVSYADFHVNYKSSVKTSSKGYTNHVIGNGNTSELTVYTNPQGNGRKVVVISDSYRHLMEDYIKRDFAKSTLAHRAELAPRTEVVMNNLAELGEGDVLFLLAVERFDFQNVEAADELVKIFAGFGPAPKKEVTTQAPVQTKSPETTRAAEPTKSPETTRSPEATSAPETTSAPEPTSAPDTTKKPEETGAISCTHIFDSGRVTKAATCEAEGEKVQTCILCGETRTAVEPKTSHSYETVKTGTASVDTYGYTLQYCRNCGKYSLSNVQNKIPDTSVLAPNYKSKTGDILATAIEGKRNWFFYAGDETEKYYTGDNVLPEAEMLRWKNSLEALQAECDKRGAKLVVMVAPNKEEMYPEYMPTTYNIKTQNKRGQVFADYMAANSTVKYVYLKDALTEAKTVYNVYWQQDTHWNSVGGYVGTVEFYKALGRPYTPFFDMVRGCAAGNITLGTKTGGDLAGFAGKSSTYTDYSVHYKDSVKTTTASQKSYAFNSSKSSELQLFQCSDESLPKGNLVVIADSYRHLMEHYLKKDFPVTLIAHRNELDYQKSDNIVYQSLEILGNNGSPDVLLLLAVERFDYQNIEAADKIVSFLRTH